MKLKDLLIGFIGVQVIIGIFYQIRSFEFYKYLITSPRFDFEYFHQLFNAGIGVIALFAGIVGLIMYFANNFQLNRILKIFLIHHTFTLICFIPVRLLWIFYSANEGTIIQWYTHLFYIISVMLAVLSIIYYAKERSINVLPVPVSSQGPRFLNYLVDYSYVMITAYGSISFFIRGYGINADKYYLFVFGVIWALLIPFIYYTVSESAFRQTIGKVLTNTYVRTSKGESASLGKIMIRSLCRYIPFEPFSYLPTPMAKWHDTPSETDVFYASKVQFEADPLIDHLVNKDDFIK